jgi:molybdopterin-guanine dinucleotide biosynthesis protein A
VVEVGPGRSGLPYVREDPPGRGPLAALAAGFAWLDAAGYRGPAIVLAVDLPRVDGRVLRLLADHPGDGTVLPCVDGRLQLVCARYGADVSREARALVAAGYGALRDLVARVPHEVLDDAALAAVGGPDVLADVDTPDDARRLGIALPDDA